MKNESLFYTYGGVDRHDFLIGIVNDVTRNFDWTAEGIEKNDAWNQIYLDLMEFLNSETTLHDRDGKPHHGAKKIVKARGLSLRGQLVAGNKTNAHEEVTNKRVRELLTDALSVEEHDAKPDQFLVRQAFSELNPGYQEMIRTVVLEDKPSTWDRRQLSRSLTSLGNKIDMKLSKHTVSMFASDDEGHEVIVFEQGYNAHRYWISEDEIFDEFPEDPNLASLSFTEALSDIYGRDIPEEFAQITNDHLSNTYGLTHFLYMWMNGQACLDDDLRKAWEFLTHDEKYLIYIRFNNIVIRPKEKRAYHERSLVATSRLTEIYEGIRAGTWDAFDVKEEDEEEVSDPVVEMPLQPSQIDSEPLLASEPSPLPDALQEALATVSEGLNALEDYFVDGFSEDKRFYDVWNCLDEMDRFWLQMGFDPEVPDRTKMKSKKKIDDATDAFLEAFKGS